MTGPLIIPKDSYSVQGDLNKVINYESMREIFLSRKESFPMETNINMNNNKIENINLPTAGHQAANKIYVDNNTNNKADLTKTTQIFQSRVQVPDFNQSSHSGLDAANINYINNKFLNKNTGGVMQNPITFQSSLSNNKKTDSQPRNTTIL